MLVHLSVSQTTYMVFVKSVALKVTMRITQSQDDTKKIYSNFIVSPTKMLMFNREPRQLKLNPWLPRAARVKKKIQEKFFISFNFYNTQTINTTV